MTYLDILRVQLRIDEGVRTFPYDDGRGFLTIGIGRNLTAKGINGEEQTLMFENDLSEAVAAARRLVPNFDSLNDARKAALVNMAFNLGYQRLWGFRKLLPAVREGRWADAAREMMDSEWARQVGSRAIRLATNMKEGVYAADAQA